MSNIKNIKKTGFNKCIGCGACASVCRTNAIIIRLNKDGFIEASVNDELCTNCGKCVSVCYKYLDGHASDNSYEYVHKNKLQQSRVFAGWSRDEEILKASSSGGIAYELARKLISDGYEIVAAYYDFTDNVVKHGIFRNIEEMKKMRGSKYIQSFTSEAFKYIQTSGKKIAFFGTPCQIYGLKKALNNSIGKDILYVDLFCSGTPSYKLWNNYLNRFSKLGITNFQDISFRDKTEGWHKHLTISATGDDLYIKEEGTFERLFIPCLNESCFSCLLRRDYIFSDIRLGDFWGPKYEENEKGVSLISVITDKGQEIWDSIKNDIEYREHSIEDMFVSQPVHFYKIPNSRKRLLKALDDNSITVKKLFWIKDTSNIKSFILHRVIPRQIRLRIINFIKEKRLLWINQN